VRIRNVYLGVGSSQTEGSRPCPELAPQTELACRARAAGQPCHTCLTADASGSPVDELQTLPVVPQSRRLTIACTLPIVLVAPRMAVCDRRPPVGRGPSAGRALSCSKRAGRATPSGDAGITSTLSTGAGPGRSDSPKPERAARAVRTTAFMFSALDGSLSGCHGFAHGAEASRTIPFITA